jgi:hypothetical protein
MHWTEYAAIVILAFVAVPFLILFYYVSRIVWDGLEGWWSPKMPAPIGKQFPAAFGIFTCERFDNWTATVQHRGRSVTVSIDDDHGAPDQAALRMLPAVLGQLPELEQAARQAVVELTSEMQLKLVSVDRGASESEVEVELCFARAGDAVESLFVDFVNGKFSGWDWVH